MFVNHSLTFLLTVRCIFYLDYLYFLNDQKICLLFVFHIAIKSSLTVSMIVTNHHIPLTRNLTAKQLRTIFLLTTNQLCNNNFILNIIWHIVLNINLYTNIFSYLYIIAYSLILNTIHTLIDLVYWVACFTKKKRIA